MTASTLATFPGIGPTERAHTRWGMNAEADAAEWHKNFMETLEHLEAEWVNDDSSPADDREDQYYWRRKFMKRFGTKCPKCLGVGMVPSYKWAHHDDWMECPLCGPLRFDTVPKVDPALYNEDDFEEIAF